ncbi:uncharacterized protein LOC124367991 [Homalodisca vitripennis]|uniref:uncharacterized protein LOC124367991 n=1 Tax=Homalodisca vitripennis TaxID=197043 RepID=UPI001EEC44CC|nr:uncharacterized protein LOC124367991 [Homalodisca vitripennis]
MGSSLSRRVLQTPTSNESESVLNKKWKSPSAYAEMLKPVNIRHFYKCMDQDCVFTHDDKHKFMKHLKNHNKLDEFRKGEKTWNLCPYCPRVIPDIQGYVSHLLKDHSNCKIQCQHCFHRSATHHDALAHLQEEHKKIKPKHSQSLTCLGRPKPKVTTPQRSLK